MRKVTLSFPGLATLVLAFFGPLPSAEGVRCFVCGGQDVLDAYQRELIEDELLHGKHPFQHHQQHVQKRQGNELGPGSKEWGNYVHALTNTTCSKDGKGDPLLDCALILPVLESFGPLDEKTKSAWNLCAKGWTKDNRIFRSCGGGSGVVGCNQTVRHCECDQDACNIGPPGQLGAGAKGNARGPKSGLLTMTGLVAVLPIILRQLCWP